MFVTSSKFMNKHETDSHKLKMATIIISIFNCIFMLIYFTQFIMLVTPCNFYMKLYLKHH